MCAGGDDMTSEKKSPEMTGVFSKCAVDFIDFKRSLGFKYEHEPKCLARFCKFATEKGIQSIQITKELAYEWIAPRPYESKKSRGHRITCVRQFAIYLNNLGYTAYILPEQKLSYTSAGFTPYIFSHTEIDNLLKAVDLTVERRVSRDMHFSLPVIFRLLYSCGLRVSEVCNLKLKDVDLENGILKLRETKNGTERYVPLSKSVHQSCIEYSKKVTWKNDEEFFFRAPNRTKLSTMTIYGRFRTYLLAAKISHGGKGKGPRLHDLRHTFAVHTLQKWIENGENLYTKLPVLSVYMGHSNVQATSRYLRLTAEVYPDLLKKVEDYSDFVIPGDDEVYAE